MYFRFHALDYLKVLLASGVVMAHAGLMSNAVPQWGYLVGLGLLRGIVPTFALLTGAGLYHTLRRGRLAGWFLRMLAVYLVWCLIYAPVWLHDGGSALWLLEQILFGPAHLWYLAGMLLATGFLALVLHRAPDEAAARKRVIVSVIITAVAGGALQYLSYFDLLPAGMNLARNGLFLIYPFAGIGYLLSQWITDRGREALPSAGWLWLILVVVIGLRLAEAAFSIAVTGFVWATLPEFPLLAYAFSVSLFLAFLRLDLPAPRADLSTMAAVIYLMHLGFILLALRLGFRNPWALFWTGLLAPALITLAMPHMPWLGRQKKHSAIAHQK